MLSAREWSFVLTPCSLALSGLPVSEASPVAGIGKSAAAIAPATATGIAEATAAHATVGPATSAAVAPGSDVRMFIRGLLEQGRPPVVAAGCCNALFDAVVSLLIGVGPGCSGANTAPGAEQNQGSKEGGGFHGLRSESVLGLAGKSVGLGLGIDPRHG